MTFVMKPYYIIIAILKVLIFDVYILTNTDVHR